MDMSETHDKRIRDLGCAFSSPIWSWNAFVQHPGFPYRRRLRQGGSQVVEALRRDFGKNVGVKSFFVGPRHL